MKIILVLVVGLLASCASVSKPGTATVCPGCKTVLVEVSDYSEYSEESTKLRKRHQCSGCQGSLITLFKEGKFEHRCSICAEGGFSCPVSHPVTGP